MTAFDKPTTAMPGPALLVHAYLDGELDVANALSVQRQIDADPAFAAEAASAAALKNVLRERFPREPVPASLLSRIDATVGRPPRWIQPTWRVLAASVLLAIALSSASTWFALQTPDGDRVVDQVVDSHMRALISSKPFDVASSERHIVKPWFNGRIPQSPRVVDLASEGFPLAGARIDVIGMLPVPTLVYTRRLHVISLSVVPAESGPKNPAIQRSLNGYNVVSWSSDSVTYLAASDLNATELQEFARQFRAAPAG
jgi:anti-sigma factor RsiW